SFLTRLLVRPFCCTSIRCRTTMVNTAFREQDDIASFMSFKSNLEHRMNLYAIGRQSVLTMVKIKEPDACHLHNPGRCDGSYRPLFGTGPWFARQCLSNCL